MTVWKPLAAAAVCLLLAGCTPVGLSTDPMPTPDKPVVTETPVPSTSEPTPVPEDTTVTLSFAGDVLVHTPVFQTAHNGDDTYDFSPFLQYGMTDFFSADWNFVNMENPVDVLGDNTDIATYPRFNAPREVGDFLRSLGVDTVSFCNNHIYDRGYKGFLATMDNLKNAGLEVAGAYQSEEEYNTPYIRDVNGVKVGLLCYTNLVNSYFSERTDRLEPFSVRTFHQKAEAAPAMVAEIQALKAAGADVVAVALHWGSEYKNEPAGTQKELARLLCEGGADLIIGGHSHCVQPMEKYTYKGEDGKEKTAYIVYSLGNFFGDQTGLQSNDKYGPSYVKTQYGMKVTFFVKKDGVTGEVTVEGGEYEPTCLLRRRVNGRYDYRFLAAGRYVQGDVRPEIFPDDGTWNKCIAAYDHVTGIVGQEVLQVKTYDGE